MNLVGILLLLLVIVLIYFLIRYMISGNGILTSIVPGNTMSSIAPTSLATGGAGASSSNYTYSVWFYINDWNYRYGEPKILFGRMGNSSSSTNSSSGISGISGMQPCPLISLGAIENNLTISTSCFPGSAGSQVSADDITPTTGNYIIHNCSIHNVPIQTWTNLLISTYGRTLDVYLNGKLVKTCLLPGVPSVNTNSSLYITPNGGFNGFTSKLQYFPHSSNPQDAWNIYVQGYNTNWFSNLFGGNYKIKVEVLNNNVSQGNIST